MEYLAWPASILILGIFFLVMFRGNIAAFMGRVREFSKGDLRIGAAPTQQTTDAVKSSAEELMRSLDTPILLEAEQMIRNDLEKRGLDYQGEVANILIRHLAASQIAYAFERIYSIIFGSQIEILNHLNTDSRGATRPELGTFYDSAAEKFPHVFQAFPFDDYFEFLRSEDLITEEADKYFISIKGREFLAYIVRSGRTMRKSF